MIGRVLGHYRILERIGTGGMGEVFRARDDRLERDVALKILPPDSLADETVRRRFRKEAHALSRLCHPHIATVHDFDTQDEIDFLVMELIPGQGLIRSHSSCWLRSFSQRRSAEGRLTVFPSAARLSVRNDQGAHAAVA